MDQGPYDLLFEPVKIGPVTAPNRFYSVPHATGHGHAAPNGSIGLREMKAKGGWGVVSMQITEIGPDSDFANHPMERLWDDSDLPAHRLLTERLKSHGALAAIELCHGGQRVKNFTSGLPVMGPSDLPVIRPEFPVQARAMDKSDIRRFREEHKRAARMARDAGYNIIYVYAAHNLSILSHFLSPYTNQRLDEYGGSFTNRIRLLREVIEDTRDAVGQECAVALRFSVEDSDPAHTLSAKGEGRDVVEALADLPDLWDVNLSSWPADSATSRFASEGFQDDFTSFVKSVTNKPVVGVGRYTSPDNMVRLVKSGHLDLIGAARPSIADPFLPNKVKDGRIDDIRECIGCNICVASDAYGIPIRCTQNPTIAEEWRRGWHPEVVPAAEKEQNILIVGAGPAGLECAWTLARSGHNVTLAEKSNQVGGRSLRESQLAGLANWRRVADYRNYQLQQKANVQMYLNSELSAREIVEFGADHVVVATGSFWRRDGVGSTHFEPRLNPDGVDLMTPDDILDGKMPGKRVLIYDDDHFYMGGVLAEHLARADHSVSIVTPHPEISAWTGFTLEQPAIVRRLSNLDVKWQTNLTLKNYGAGKAQFCCALTAVERDEFDFDTMLIVGARSPNDHIYDGLKSELATDRHWLVGDCHAPGTMQAAVFSGHRVARKINGDLLAAENFRRESAILISG